MMSNFTCRLSILTLFVAVAGVQAAAQTSIRPYTQVYSENLKGGSVIFGNTLMQVEDNGSVNLVKMNETGDPANGQGGIGYSQYGNDQENMTFTDIDVTPANLNVFNLGSGGWKYLANGSNQATAWRTLNNPGSPWIAGTASFGYGHAQTTTITGGSTTAYFLKNITITDPLLYSSFNFTYSYDDGAVVYVNGVEVQRANLPAGTITYTTPALLDNYITGATFSIPASYFTAGNNIIAVEIHQNAAISSDAYFDMGITAIGRSTFNSSSANLILPAGINTIKFARLYWGGRIDNFAVASVPDTLRRIRIRKGTTGGYTNAIAPPSNVDTFEVNFDETIYQAYVDVTSFIQANGTGTYTIADIAATPGLIDGGGKYAGWAIVVAYENPALNYTSVRIYDGYSKIFDDGFPITQTITLTGLNVPANPLLSSEAVMSTVVWEGDANLGAGAFNLNGDYLKINTIPVSNAVNPVTNFWNGSISKNGVFVTGTKNPDYFNQMGIDIDEVNVGTGYNILPNATSVTFEFGTEADQYFPSVFAFAIRMKNPEISINKSVADASGNMLLDPNEILTYTLSGTNLGPGIAYFATVTDSLPTNVTYVPNSLQVVNAPGTIPGIKSDAADNDNAFLGTAGGRNYIKFFIGTGWTPTSGGQLPVGSAYTLKFKVMGGAIPGSVTNTARITANTQGGDQLIDDGTAVISPAGGPVDIKLSSFTAILNNNDGLLNWVSESEINASHFEIERSDDAIHFSKRGLVISGGYSTATRRYSYRDPLTDASGIVYYRLKMIDLDGRFEYSKTVALRLNGIISDHNLNVYPNPFITDIKVQLLVAEDFMATFRLLSFDGKQILNRRVWVEEGQNIIVLKDLAPLAKGNYILEVTTAEGKLINKIIKD